MKTQRNNKLLNMKNKEYSKYNKTFTLDFWVYLFIFIVLIGVICYLPTYFTKSERYSCYKETGTIGDTIGGIMGPFVAIAAAILTFLAFWVQFKANEQQRKDIAKERFESKFYELLHLHRKNLIELEKDGRKGRQSIALFCNYISILYSLIDGFFLKYFASDTDVLNIYQNIVKNYKNERYLFIDIAYNIFFYGEKIINKLEGNELFLYKKIIYMINKVCIFEYMKEENISSLLDNITSAPNKYFNRGEPYEKVLDSEKVHCPLNLLKGNNGILGLYFRQLYHIVKMIATSQVMVDEKEKYEYVKILRTQLSDYEQILLYYNSLANMGKKWNEPNQMQSSSNNEYSWIENMAFIPRFRLIKNVPPSYKFIGVTPEEVYKNEINLYNEHNIKFFELK